MHDGKIGPEVVIRELVMPYLDRAFDSVRTVLPGHDLALTHTMSFAIAAHADKLKIPRLSVLLQPVVMFSSHDPGIIVGAPGLHHLSRFPWLYEQVMKQGIKKPTRWVEPVQALREREGLPRLKESPIGRGQFSEVGNLVLFPKELAPPQVDWPTRTYQLGFPFYDQDGSAELSEATAAFLKTGPPPILFTLGSSVVMTKTPFYQTALEAMSLIGGRAIFLYGRNPDSVPAGARNHPDIHLAEYEPFSKLFPRGAVVVHQCGIGTTGQALRSGRPQLLVPFSHDQPDNADRVARLGCGLVLPARKLDALRMARALRSLRDEPRFDAKAQQVARQVDQGDFTTRVREALRETMGW